MSKEIYKLKRTYADIYINEQIKICSKLFNCQVTDFRQSTQLEDYNGVDLFQGHIRISLRIRNRPQKDLTIRLTKDINGQNELTKLTGGNMDYMLLNKADEVNEGKISDFFLFDCEKLKDKAMELFPDIQTQIYSGSDYKFQAINIDDLFDKSQGSVITKGFTRTVEIENEDGSISHKYMKAYDMYAPDDFYKYK